MPICPCCKVDTNNFGNNVKLCRPCNLLKPTTRARRYDYKANYFSEKVRNKKIRRLTKAQKDASWLENFDDKYRAFLNGENAPIRRSKLRGSLYLKFRARKLVELAIRRKDLVRPGKCSRCEEVKNIQAHHPDYYKPLEIVWLCHRCHVLEHLQATRA